MRGSQIKKIILLGIWTGMIGHSFPGSRGDSTHLFNSSLLYAQDDMDFGSGGDSGGDLDMGDSSTSGGGGDPFGDSTGGDSTGGDSTGGETEKKVDMGDSMAGDPPAGGPPKKIVPYKPAEKDPFDVLVKKEIILPPPLPTPSRPRDGNNDPAVPKPPPVPPVNVQVLGIVGNDSKRVALVTFENETMTISKGFTDSKGKFKVVDVEKDKLIIYSFKEGFRKTFKLPDLKIGEGGGGGEAGGGGDGG